MAINHSSESKQVKIKGRNQGYDELPYGYDGLSFEILNKKLREKLNLGVISKDIIKTLVLIKNEKYTNAAALLSDNHPQHVGGISLIRFEGTSVNQIRDRLILKNISILEMFDRAIELYHKHNIRKFYNSDTSKCLN